MHRRSFFARLSGGLAALGILPDAPKAEAAPPVIPESDQWLEASWDKVTWRRVPFGAPISGGMHVRVRWPEDGLDPQYEDWDEDE